MSFPLCASWIRNSWVCVCMHVWLWALCLRILPLKRMLPWYKDKIEFSICGIIINIIYKIKSCIIAYLFSPSKHWSCLDLQSLVSRLWSVSLSLSRPRSRSRSLSLLEGSSLRSAATGASESSLREILPDPILRVGISLWDSRCGLSVGESGRFDTAEVCWRPWHPVLKLLRCGDNTRPSCSSCWNYEAQLFYTGKLQ